MRFGSGLIAALWLTTPILAAQARDGAATTAAEPQSASDALRAAAEAIDPLGQAAEAEAAWKTYLEALETSGGSAEDQAFALNRMGDSRYYQQDGQTALEASLEARRRLEEAGATAGEAMADTLANLATFYGVVGESDQELPLQEQSLAIRKRLYGDNPIGLPASEAKSLGLGYLNYANALYVNGRFAEAADLIKPSVDGLIEGQLQDATLFVAMSSGANMLSDAGRQVEALDMAQRGVAIATELL
ncbi:MAG: tetratricopeptide repeat protein, partial [Pontixanthobacter sp.]